MKQKLTILSCTVAIALLILDTKTALAGASDGIELCLNTMIPSLFPFICVTILLNSALLGQRISLLNPIGRILRISDGIQSIVAVGMLGGYPVGAQSVSQAYQRGSLSEESAKRMLAFCSNAGPAFLFGIGVRILPKLWMCWLLWGIHILSAWFVGVLTPGRSDQKETNIAYESITVPQALQNSIQVTLCVCGWIVIFRVFIAFLQRWVLWLLPTTAQILLLGLLELANGCCAIADVDSIGQRFLMLASMLGFGGLCVTMQTYSVCCNLSVRWYLPGKLVQSAISLLLATALQVFFPIYDRCSPPLPLLGLCCTVCIVYGLSSRIIAKKSSFLPAVGV